MFILSIRLVSLPKMKCSHFIEKTETSESSLHLIHSPEKRAICKDVFRYQLCLSN